MVDTAIGLNGTRVLCSTDDFGCLKVNARYHHAGSNPASLKMLWCEVVYAPANVAGETPIGSIA